MKVMVEFIVSIRKKLHSLTENIRILCLQQFYKLLRQVDVFLYPLRNGKRVPRLCQS